jgi:dUTP pyrophosphatase
MKLRIKKLHPDAVIPKYTKEGDAGMDLVTPENAISSELGVFTYRTGLAVEIPQGYVGLVFPRSSVYKSAGRLANSVGVIDSGYRGEIFVKFDASAYSQSLAILRQVSNKPSDWEEIDSELEGIKGNSYKKGDRIAQLVIMPVPNVEFEEVEELSETTRGEGGFGSTGK